MMMKMIELEWRKWNIKKYVRYVVMLTIVLLIFLIVTAGTAGADNTSMGFYERSIINAAVELYTNMSYIVFTGTMLASFIVGEYEKGTIALMFSYPIKRRNILLSKIFCVWIFSVVALVLSKLSIYIVLLCLKTYINVSAQDIPVDSLIFWLDMVTSSVTMISISYISLSIGLLTKSSKLTVIAAVLVACFSHGNIRGYTLLGNWYYYSTLIVLAVLSIYLSLRNIEIDDVMQ